MRILPRLLLVGACVATFACSQPPAADEAIAEDDELNGASKEKVLREVDAGRVSNVGKGDVLKIMLGEPPKSGARWEVVESSAGKPSKDDFLPNLGLESANWENGARVFSWQTAALSGKHTIVVAKTLSSSELKRLKFTFDVQGSGSVASDMVVIERDDYNKTVTVKEGQDFEIDLSEYGTSSSAWRIQIAGRLGEPDVSHHTSFRWHTLPAGSKRGNHRIVIERPAPNSGSFTCFVSIVE